MARIGVVQRRQREAGSWVIDEDPLGEGRRLAGLARVPPGRHHGPGAHPVPRHRARGVRDRAGAGAAQVAEHEYRIMSRLPNDGCSAPRDMVDNDLGIGLVYPLRRALPAPGPVAGRPGRPGSARRSALARSGRWRRRSSYAHRQPGRAPRPDPARRSGPPPGPTAASRVLVGDWQSAGTVTGAGATGCRAGVSDLARCLRTTSLPTDRGGAPFRPGPWTWTGGWPRRSRRRKASGSRTPTGSGSMCSRSARSPTTSWPAGSPAADRTTLRERLHRDRGLDLAVDLPQVTARAARLWSSTPPGPAVSERLPDVRSVPGAARRGRGSRRRLGEDVIDPLEAAPGAVIDGRFRLQRRLGAGSTAVGLLVTDLSIAESGPDARAGAEGRAERRGGGAARRRGEGARRACGTRASSGSSRARSRSAGGRPCVLESAGDETLGEVLRGRGPTLAGPARTVGRATCWKPWSRWTGPGSITGTSSRPTSASGRGAATGSSTWCCSTSRCLARPRPPSPRARRPTWTRSSTAPRRGRFDSAAERYSAAVVLFEMATGRYPGYGDGLSDPARSRTRPPSSPACSTPPSPNGWLRFFRRPSRAMPGDRHDTAGRDARRLGRRLRAGAQDSAGRCRRACRGGPAGHAARPGRPVGPGALRRRAARGAHRRRPGRCRPGAAEPPVRAWPSRRAVRSRSGHGSGGTGSARPSSAESGSRQGRAVGHGIAPGPGRGGGPAACARWVRARAESGGPWPACCSAWRPGRRPIRDARPSSARSTGVTRGRAAQQLDAPAGSVGRRRRLPGSARHARRRGVAALDRLRRCRHGGRADRCDARGLPPASRGLTGRPRPASPQAWSGSRLTGCRRCNRAEADDCAFTARRRDGRIALLAADPALLDPAEALGRAADELVDQAAAAGEPLVPAARAVQRLRDVWARAVAAPDPAPAAPDAGRLLRLAAELARDAALAGSGDLYPPDLPATAAVTIALGGHRRGAANRRAGDPATGSAPSSPPCRRCPSGPGSTSSSTGRTRPGLRRGRAHVTAHRRAPSGHPRAGLPPRHAPWHRSTGSCVADGPSGHRLTETAASRSFLAHRRGCRIRRPGRRRARRPVRRGQDRPDPGPDRRRCRRRPPRSDLTGTSSRPPTPPPPAPGTPQGLAALVQRSLPAVDSAIKPPRPRRTGGHPAGAAHGGGTACPVRTT